MVEAHHQPVALGTAQFPAMLTSTNSLQIGTGQPCLRFASRPNRMRCLRMTMLRMAGLAVTETYRSSLCNSANALDEPCYICSVADASEADQILANRREASGP